MRDEGLAPITADTKVPREGIKSNQRLALFGRFAITGIHPEKFSGVLSWLFASIRRDLYAA
jgi:hypothetical protein